ncbi:dTDP-4-dehydrorhamnose reductase [bacterium]|nr:dTDP-4-dehydrorhamnose reductase [bacterium]
MSSTKVIVSGGSGQLGSEIAACRHSFPQLDVSVHNRQTLDITDFEGLEAFLKTHKPAYFVNCAAYTAVDQAEDEPEKADWVNHQAVAHLAKICHQLHITLIHISTDYVFNGKAQHPYKPSDSCDPIGAYGKSKWLGEEAIKASGASALIIRTAWVYSSYGKNFVKTMLRLGAEKESIGVVADQIGAPTYAADLASAILHIIATAYQPKGTVITHYTNAGTCSWAQFARQIMELKELPCVVNDIATADYKTKAKRPAYSVLGLDDFCEKFPEAAPQAWPEALSRCLSLL